MIGILDWIPVRERMDLVAEPVARLLGTLPDLTADIRVAEIDPGLADTAAFCERYQVPLGVSANCVIVAAKRGGEVSYAACNVLATMRADVNSAIRRHLGARKATFAPMDSATSLTGMEYGGITPVGVPAGWPILVDSAVAAEPYVVIGAGVRAAKLLLPGKTMAALPGAEVIDLAMPVQ
jgi:prolyl-tRNA editing enzyme YbaK/EbsC (Cys-tRNA(Pro) deacylase)